jgi:hypothetical protein
MKKMSRYSRKRMAPGRGTYNGAAWLNTIQAARAYSNEVIPGGWVEGTETASTKALLLVRDALTSLNSHVRPTDCELVFDRLAHAVGVAMIRALQIEPDEQKNPAIPILKDGTQALTRAIERYKNAGAWGLDALGRPALLDAIEVYAEILNHSSPAQMTKATDMRIQIIEGMK